MVKKEGVSKFVSFIRAFGVTVGALISFVFFIIILMIAIAIFIPAEDLAGGNIAVVPITGVISTNGDSGLVDKSGTPSHKIVSWIKEADKDEDTKAIILQIDSPGGSPVASDEIGRAIKEVEKPVVAVIREKGTSGAFWIATTADYIFANRMSLTGSIGVIGSKLEFSGLLEDYNITYRRLIAGKYKDAGSRWKEMTEEERVLYQKLLDEIHTEFIREVARNRNLPFETVQEYAHGFVFTGAEAKEIGLIDELGNKDDAVKYLEKKLGIEADLYEFKPISSFFSEILGISSYNIGRGIGTSLTTQATTETFDVTI